MTSIAGPHKRLEGKVAIITGGASGIGACTAELFHENGAKVVIADIQDDLGQALATKLGGKACYIHCDVSKEDDVINLVDTTVAKYGRLDIMFNNAGIIEGQGLPVSVVESEKSDLDRLLSVNLGGAFLGAKHATRVMVQQRKGCILFTSSLCTSIAGLSGHAYAASKSGVCGLAKNLTPELGKYGIRVNCISPYGLVTGISNISEANRELVEAMLSELGTLSGQTLRADGIAKAALFLASDEAYYVSGINMVVDGGYSVVNPRLADAIYSKL
uniref:Tropinone reductase-like 1 n=1 Tax=Erythroxylum coca TaxID=289672 RepID=TPRL1_ERYCB|nr:RecName: Full=Tropinone reductase-like 1 [Erythroxylum coca]AFD32319.1 tropinone reductase-like 1 [Erythroxylum coca]